MKTFAFFFGLCLGQRLYSLTDNLSKTLQSEKLSAVSGHRLALLTKDTLINMRNEESFKMFYGVILKKAANHPQIEHLTLPRKRKRPNYSILNYVEGHSSAEGHHPATVEDHYRCLYYNAVDSIVQALMPHFDQPSFKAFCAMEQLLLKGIEDQDVSGETAEVQKIYGDDINFGSLSTELTVLKTICKDEKPSHTKEIVKALKGCDHRTWLLIPFVIKLVKLLLVMAATSATPERSFSTMRRLKTWLRSSMKQKRFNSLAILTSHKVLTDEINFAEVGNTVISGHRIRYNRTNCI